MYFLVFDAIGTRWQIDIKTPISPLKRNSIEKQIKKRIEEFDRIYSRFRPDSLVRKMAAAAGLYKLPPDGALMLSLYQELYKLTGGYFTPLIGQVLVDAGYDEKYSLIPKKLSIPPTWEEALSFQAPPPGGSHGFLRQPADPACHLPGVRFSSPGRWPNGLLPGVTPTLTVKKPSLLDFGAAGKGYLIDIAGGILEKNGVSDYTIEAGGDIRNRTEGKTLRVGLENPQNTGQVIGIAYVGNQSICGSAGNRRRWANYHHIIDPFTLKSPRDILATWVVAESTMLADAISTCLFLVSPEILLERYEFEFVILYSDFSLKKSVGFEGELFYD